MGVLWTLYNTSRCEHW